jgi:thiamine kinase-like enzyme
LAIDRDAEYANSVAAASTGVAPGVLAYLPELGALVIEWIEGRTFEAADLDDTDTLTRVAATCRRLHAGPRFAGDFDMFVLQRRYLDLVVSRGFRLPPSYDDFTADVTRIRSAMAVRDEGTVPCHNDLLAANIMAGGDQLWFVDFEYSGNADPCFELGNLCSEAHLGPDRLEELVAAYYGVATPGKIARARLFGIMSDYGWTLWAAIQAATSELDFDFWSWGLEKFERASAQFRGPDLSRLISEVQQP